MAGKKTVSGMGRPLRNWCVTRLSLQMAHTRAPLNTGTPIRSKWKLIRLSRWRESTARGRAGTPARRQTGAPEASMPSVSSCVVTGTMFRPRTRPRSRIRSTNPRFTARSASSYNSHSVSIQPSSLREICRMISTAMLTPVHSSVVLK